MIITENVVINGIEYKRSYSDGGFKIQRDNVQYDEAVDDIDSDRVYTETDILIVTEEAKEEDYLLALERLGVSE